MRLHLEAHPAELAELSADELVARIERAAPLIAETALTEALNKAKEERADTPAEPHERVRGSKKNPKGSARSRTSGAKIKVTKQIEDALRDKVKAHNEKAKHKWQKVSLATLKSVFRRGAGAYSVSHRPSQNRQSWAYARVNAFLEIAMGGGNPKFVQDNDLLHDSHPRNKSTKGMETFTKGPTTRGGEVDLVVEIAQSANAMYLERLAALSKDIEALVTQVGADGD